MINGSWEKTKLPQTNALYLFFEGRKRNFIVAMNSFCVWVYNISSMPFRVLLILIGSVLLYTL
jgi:hypothetical protein